MILPNQCWLKNCNFISSGKAVGMDKGFPKQKRRLSLSYILEKNFETLFGENNS